MPEPQSRAVYAAVMSEESVLISALTELESVVQLRGMRLGGGITSSEHKRLIERLNVMKQLSPFSVHKLSGDVFIYALSQHHADEKLHCRPLDRLHLAAMEDLGIKRLMTNDVNQAAAAKALGYSVVMPQ